MLGTFLALNTVGPRPNAGIDDWLGPFLRQVVFPVAVIVGATLAVVAGFLAWRREGLEWLAFGAVAFAAASVGVSFAVPVNAGQGPIVARNTSAAQVLIRLETISGSWLLNSGEQATLLDNRPAHIRGAFLFDPKSCEETAAAEIRLTGAVLLVIGEPAEFVDVAPLRSQAQGAVPPSNRQCPHGEIVDASQAP